MAGAGQGRGGRPPPLLPRRLFARRVGAFAAFAAGGLGFSLAAGVLGYRYVAGLGWVDAVFNAAMILSGMGPVSPMPTDAAKLFASAYALAGGLAWAGLVGVLLFPFIHRMLHALHLAMRGEEDE